MADEFRSTEVCGGNWFSSFRSPFGSSPCASSIGEMGSFGWSSDLVDMKVRSSDESDSVSDGSILIQDMQKSQQPNMPMMNSNNFQMTEDWNQALLGGSGRIENNYNSIQEDLNSYHKQTGEDCPQIQRDWSPKNFSGCCDNSSINSFKKMNQSFSLDQQPLNSITGLDENTATCQGLSTSFPLSSTSYGYPSTFLQTLFDTAPQPQEPLFNNQSMNYSSTTCYQTNLNEFVPSLPKFSSFNPKQQPSSHLQSNNTTFWNVSAAALNNIRTNFLPSTQSQILTSTFEEKINLPNLTAKLNTEEGQEQGLTSKKTSSEPVFKRPRIETPSPTFKVRKEKLGDRITALQQLVSPFGKTDTASVLHEAIECIKYLHDQVSVLSTAYIKNGAPVYPKQTPDKLKDLEERNQDLRSLGLCLVPISSTFPVAAETAADLWAPTFGGTFR